MIGTVSLLRSLIGSPRPHISDRSVDVPLLRKVERIHVTNQKGKKTKGTDRSSSFITVP